MGGCFSVSSILQKKVRVVIGHFPHKDRKEYDTLRRVASTLKDDCQFHVGFGYVISIKHDDMKS